MFRGRAGKEEERDVRRAFEIIRLYDDIFIFLNRSWEKVAVLRISDFRGDWRSLSENTQKRIRNETGDLGRKGKPEKNNLAIICLRAWLL